MFISLLAATFALALIVSFLVSYGFKNPVEKILNRIVSDEISDGWLKYLRFAILVVGVSSGVRLYELERYITPSLKAEDAVILELTNERWLLELYRTVIQTLQGIAWMLLVFFVFALIAYVIVRIGEMKKKET